VRAGWGGGCDGGVVGGRDFRCGTTRRRDVRERRRCGAEGGGSATRMAEPFTVDAYGTVLRSSNRFISLKWNKGR
jgi:hypothetical protein